MNISKKQKPVLVLLIVLVVLILAYVGLNVYNNGQDKKAEEEAKADTIYVTDIDSIQYMDYDFGSGETTFECVDDTWYYTQDKDFPLDESYPSSMAKTLGSLKADRELTDGDSLADYGLENPGCTVKVKDADGVETDIYIGNATGDYYYVTVGTEGKVYTVASTEFSDMQTAVTDMAALDTFPTIGSGNLKKVEITENDTTTTIDSENDDDAEKIATSAGGLSVVALDTVADYSADEAALKKFGLEETTSTKVVVTYTDNKEEKTITFYLGTEDGNGNRYMKLANSDIVYQVKTSTCDNILGVTDDSE
ncbi:MAG: DUF4340 domain-containing protein [Hespellia sp.]|nr:DUF4340 domain-containing protein [Hespellia sp.]